MAGNERSGLLPKSLGSPSAKPAGPALSPPIGHRFPLADKTNSGMEAQGRKEHSDQPSTVVKGHDDKKSSRRSKEPEKRIEEAQVEQPFKEKEVELKWLQDTVEAARAANEQKAIKIFELEHQLKELQLDQELDISLIVDLKAEVTQLKKSLKEAQAENLRLIFKVRDLEVDAEQYATDIAKLELDIQQLKPLGNF